jgi:hypothetical protein
MKILTQESIMPTRFSLTFDSMYKSLVLVSDKRIVADLKEVHIEKADDGSYNCSIIHDNGGNPVRLVASASPEGKKAIERAAGVETSLVPGFIEVSSSKAEVAKAADEQGGVAADVARFFGCDVQWDV